MKSVSSLHELFFQQLFIERWSDGLPFSFNEESSIKIRLLIETHFLANG